MMRLKDLLCCSRERSRPCRSPALRSALVAFAVLAGCAAAADADEVPYYGVLPAPQPGMVYSVPGQDGRGHRIQWYGWVGKNGYYGTASMGGLGYYHAGAAAAYGVPPCGGCGHCALCAGKWKVKRIPAVSWLVDPHYYARSPDWGYAPPVSDPMVFHNLTYFRYWPEQWYGHPDRVAAKRYPIVGQPTDTTQFGYYYQHVPVWGPRKGAIPKPPNPLIWHTRAYNTQLDGSYDVWVPLQRCPASQQGYDVYVPLQQTPQQAPETEKKPQEAPPAPSTALGPIPNRR
ncbi:MAG: hypothetical protein D6725_02635 [Planctomycetota bacterium]|nr:MAG: hypothetical protein D6725_02635 [Planctomycetota bacterium]